MNFFYFTADGDHCSIPVNSSASPFLWVVWYLVLWMYHSLFIHMPIDEFLHFFEIIVTNSVRMYCYCCLVAKSYLTLYGHMDCGSSIHGNSQARILEWVAISFSRGFSWPRDWTYISCIEGRCFATEALGKPIYIILMNWIFEGVHSGCSSIIHSVMIYASLSSGLGQHVRIISLLCF